MKERRSTGAGSRSAPPEAQGLSSWPQKPTNQVFVHQITSENG
jgi:hypothetical protein